MRQNRPFVKKLNFKLFSGDMRVGKNSLCHTSVRPLRAVRAA